jgi:1-acyl-sn-glycerol-3-phosphate acyltransferase
MLDATLVVALLRQLDTVVEMSWAEAPIVAGAVARAGYLRNDSARKVVEEGAARLRAGRRLLIFPEGSRSPAGSLHPFRRGAARIALASGCDPVPLVIRCDPPIGLKGKAWYDIPKGTPKMSISVGEPVAVETLVDEGDSRGVAARKINEALRDYFLRELSYADVRHD